MNNMQYSYCEAGEMSYKSLQEALKLVKKAVQGEREDELFYGYLISVAPTKQEADIITDIRDDERKHNQMFHEIYTYFTGEELPQPHNSEFKEPSSYKEGIKKAFFGELAAMERYRDIRAGIPTRYFKDMVFEILTDEMKHADKYNYILNLNTAVDEQVIPMQDNTAEKDKESDEKQYTPDQLLTYINFLVKRALEEAKEGVDLENLLQEYIIAGVLVGVGFTPEQAIEEVMSWEDSEETMLFQGRKKSKER